MFYTGRKCTPQTTRKRYVYFLNQLLIFLVLFIVDATVFYFVGGLGIIELNFAVWVNKQLNLCTKVNESSQYSEK